VLSENWINREMTLFLGVYFLGAMALASDAQRAGVEQKKVISSPSQSKLPKMADYDVYFDSCQKSKSLNSKGQISAINPNHLGIPALVQKDQNGVQAFDLVNAAYKHTDKMLKQNLEKTKESKKCLKAVFSTEFKNLTTFCQDVYVQIMQTSASIYRARLQLAMALPSSSELTPLQYKTLNTNLNVPVNTFKVEKWMPLSKDEKNRLSQEWTELLSIIEKKASMDMKPSNSGFMSGADEYKKNLIQQVRQKALLNYHIEMTQYPLIQFLKSSEPTEKEFESAYDKAIQSIEKEIDNIRAHQNKLVLSDKKIITEDDLFILNYASTEEVLRSNGQFCSVAQSLVEYQKLKNMYVSYGSMVLFIGASYLKVPATALLTAGIGLSGLSLYQSQVEYKKALQAHLASPSYDDQVFRKSKVDESKEGIVLNSAFLGLAGAGGLSNFRQAILISKQVAGQQVTQFFNRAKSGL